jgi:hypothetical protein
MMESFGHKHHQRDAQLCQRISVGTRAFKVYVHAQINSFMPICLYPLQGCTCISLS